MAHLIEQHTDGTAAFVAARTPAWHMLGTVIDRDDLTIPEAMEAAHLNGWEVRKDPALAFADASLSEPVERTERWAFTTRRNPFDADAPRQALGIVGMDTYTVVQNEEAFAWTEALTDSGLYVEAAGSLRDGTQPFMLLRLPETIKIGGADEILPYLHVATSHDGSLAVTYNATAVRVVCANTQALALSQPTPRYAIRHTGTALEGRISEARQALQIAHDTLDEFQKQAEAWLARDITAREFDKITEGLFPTAPQPTDAEILAAERKRDAYRLAYNLPTQDGIRGTAWGALQAAWEMDEWLGKAKPDAQALRSINSGDTRRPLLAKRISKALALA